MPTDTFPLASAANEGCGGWHKSGAWPPTIADFINEDNDPSNFVFVSKYDTGNSGLENSFWRWDTSSIPITSTINSVDLSFYLGTRTETGDNFSLIGDYYDFGGQATVAGDVVETISSPIFTVDISTLTLGAVNTISLTNLTGIKRSGEVNGQGFTGFTGIRIGFTAGTPTSMNALEIANFASANQEARLIVSHSAGISRSQRSRFPKPILRSPVRRR